MIHDLTRKTIYLNRSAALSLIERLAAAIAQADKNEYLSAFSEPATEWERDKPDAPGCIKFAVLIDYDIIGRVKG